MTSNNLQSSQEVFRIISKAAYFSIFSVPDPQAFSIGVPLIPFIPASIYKIRITEAPRRHQISVAPPTPKCGFQTSKRGSSRQIANQRLLLEMMPNNFQAGSGRTPPPTLLLPFLSQRFYMSEGEFDFLDPEQSGFRAHAAGRFFPATVGGTLHLRIGSIVEILKYLGRLEGLQGNLVVNGYTIPPQVFANNFIIRFVDPEGRLSTDEPIQPVEDPLPDPEPNIGFIPLLSELHPDHPMQITPLPNSAMKQVRLVERLRLVDTAFDVIPTLRSRTVPGEVVGERTSVIVFDPEDPNSVIPLYSRGGEFKFFADSDKPIGTVKADFFEGRAFRTTLPQLNQPFFRYCGFGPFTESTGQFENVVGMISCNGALSLTPGSVSSMYMLRMIDPQGRFRSVWQG